MKSALKFRIGFNLVHDTTLNHTPYEEKTNFSVYVCPCPSPYNTWNRIESPSLSSTCVSIGETCTANALIASLFANVFESSSVKSMIKKQHYKRIVMPYVWDAAKPHNEQRLQTSNLKKFGCFTSKNLTKKFINDFYRFHNNSFDFHWNKYIYQFSNVIYTLPMERAAGIHLLKNELSNGVRHWTHFVWKVASWAIRWQL